MTVLSLSELVNYLHDAQNKIFKTQELSGKARSRKQLQK